jgi:hypothetical protein
MPTALGSIPNTAKTKKDWGQKGHQRKWLLDSWVKGDAHLLAAKMNSIPSIKPMMRTGWPLEQSGLAACSYCNNIARAHTHTHTRTRTRTRAHTHTHTHTRAHTHTRSAAHILQMSACGWLLGPALPSLRPPMLAPRGTYAFLNMLFLQFPESAEGFIRNHSEHWPQTSSLLNAPKIILMRIPLWSPESSTPGGLSWCSSLWQGLAGH